MGRIAWLAILCLGWSESLWGQIRREPGVVIDGKVVVRVYVVLRDEETPYYPVTGLQLRFFRSATDSVIATTDDAGTLTTLLPPGDYRLVSARDVVWKGNRYSWSIPLTVSPGMLAIDLREPAASEPNATRVIMKEKTPRTVGANTRTARGEVVSSTSDAERSGFWLAAGMGLGSTGCDGCSGRITGLSGNLALGGTLSSHVLLGAFVNGWTKKESSGATLTVGAATLGVRVYPSASNGFFLAAGLGVANVDLQPAGFKRARATGTGGMLGVGWDIRVWNAASVTPFWNGVGAEFDGNKVNFGQIGLGITWH